MSTLRPMPADVTDALDFPIPGVHEDLPSAEYHRGPGISKSGLDLIARSPAHYAWSRAHPSGDTPATALGTAFHALVLEPDLFHDVVVRGLEKEPGVKLARRSKADKLAWTQFEAEHAGKIILTRDQLATVENMADAVRAHPVASILLDPDDPGPAEASAYWRDPATDMLCRCRPDKVNRAHNVLVDLKSTIEADVGSASFNAFARSAAAHRYHVSDAMSIAGWAAASGERPQAYIFVAVEKDPPHGVLCFQFDAEARERGRELLARDLDTYAHCVARDEWPGYPTEIQSLSLPRWAMYD